MQEVTVKTVEIKTNDEHRDKHCLVHDGNQVISLCSGSTRAAIPADMTMLVGTENELKAEVEKLKLQPETDLRQKAKTVREAMTGRKVEGSD